MHLNFKILMLISAPIIIAILYIRPAYAEMDGENTYQRGLTAYSNTSIKKDAFMAANLFKEAAEQGHIEAAFSLGVLYQNGEGVPKNSKEAIKWYTTAAEQNHIKAQFNLGL